MSGRKAADASLVEGIKDENDDGEIEKGKNQRRKSGQERSARGVGRDCGCVGGAHRKDHRFSRRSVRKSSEMVRRRMQTEIAAPSGQS